MNIVGWCACIAFISCTGNGIKEQVKNHQFFKQGFMVPSLVALGLLIGGILYTVVTTSIY